MIRLLGVFLAAFLALSLPAAAKVVPFPPGMRVMDVLLDGVTLHVRVGGKGPAILMVHGFGDTGDMWAPLARAMIAGHTLVIPDLRGMGLSSHPDMGYDKKTQGRDMAALLDKLKIGKVDLVTHDIGNMVGYAFAAQLPMPGNGASITTHFVIRSGYCAASA